MIVFKTFLKVLNKGKGMILLYTAILIVFAIFNMQNSETANTFLSEKPDIAIVLEDEKIGLTKNLVEYLEKENNCKEIKEEKLKDALFYRDVNLIIKIPKNYRMDVLNGKDPEIEIESTGDYQASLGKMILEKYLRIQNIYQKQWPEETELMANINETLNQKVETELASKIDTFSLAKAKFYFNFCNYAILAGLVFVITWILSSFKEEKIKKRTTISSMKDKTFNHLLFLSNSIFSVLLWLLYVILAFMIVGKAMWSIHGLLFIINTLLFSFCALSISLLIGNISQNKEAINGVVNVIALGSSFLCGAFVPTEFLPKSVLMFSRILPSYWFIKTNEEISILEKLDYSTLKPILINMVIILLFTLFFAILTNIISKKKGKQ